MNPAEDFDPGDRADFDPGADIPELLEVLEDLAEIERIEQERWDEYHAEIMAGLYYGVRGYDDE